MTAGPAGTDPDDLQFDRAEFVDRAASPSHCVVCRSVLGGSYYVVSGRVVCEACRSRIGASLTGGSGTVRFVRALVAGCAAAALGAGVYYALAALTGYEIGLVAIVVGLLVGYAVRWGSAGRGGWPYQALAMVLTYAAIVSTYIPYISVSEGPPPGQVAPEIAPGSDASLADPQPDASPAAPQPDASSAAAIQGEDSVGTPADGGWLAQLPRWALVFLLACAAPFLLGVRNIMGWIIIGIGLYEAWKINRRVQVPFAGPYPVAPSGGAATS